MNKEPVSITIHRYRQDPVLGTLGRLSMTSGLSGGYLFRVRYTRKSVARC